MKLFTFLDLETTGLDPQENKILEIGWLITNENFEVLNGPQTWIVEHEDGWGDVWAQLRENLFVDQMHKDSGLSHDLQAKHAYTLSAIAIQLALSIRKLAGEDEPDVHLAGFSVGFDRSFLEAIPEFREMFNSDLLGFQFHHRLLDLSALKLMFEATGVPWEKASNPKPHRAYYDVIESLEQAQIFQRMLGALAVGA